MVEGSSPDAVTQASDFAPASSRKFLDIQTTIQCGFTVKHVRDMIRTYSQATVRPIFEKDDRANIKSYRFVSLLNIFSKIYKRFLHENLTNYVETFLSKFISAYRKSYSSNHILIHLTENWKKSLDQKKFVGAVLMYLSKAFDSIPHSSL